MPNDYLYNKRAIQVKTNRPDASIVKKDVSI